MASTILILSNSDSGLFDFRKEVLSELLARGYRVLVSVPDTGYADRIGTLGCELIPTSFERRGMNPWKDMKLLLFYGRLMRKYRPKAVFTYTIKPNIYGALAAGMARIPCLVNITGLGTTLEHDGPLQRMILLMYRAALRKAACVFFQNEGNRDFLTGKGCITGKARVIPGSGVNLQEHCAEEYPGAGEKTVFVSVMRLMKDKGIDELLYAAERVHARHPDTVFRLLGAYEEESRAHYEPFVQRLAGLGCLEYYGYRDDVPAFLKGCQAVVHPSYHEGMSNVLLEAAASARPVLASAVTGCLDTFQDGIGGFAFPPRDGDGLVEALERFLALPWEERRRMGLAGRRFVEERFDRRLVVAAYMEELEQQAKSNTPPQAAGHQT